MLCLPGKNSLSSSMIINQHVNILLWTSKLSNPHSHHALQHVQKKQGQINSPKCYPLIPAKPPGKAQQSIAPGGLQPKGEQLIKC